MPKMDRAALLLGFCLLAVFALRVIAAPIVTDAREEYPLERECLYQAQRYPHGASVETEQPCLNCTCNRGALVCFLRVCHKLVAPPNSGCKVMAFPGKCCSEIVCGADAEIADSAATTVTTTALAIHPQRASTASRNGDESSPLTTTVWSTLAIEDTTLDPTDLNVSDHAIASGCPHNGSVYADGSAMPSQASCQYCYCIRGLRRCLRPQCHLRIEGCQPVYRKELSCCPMAYKCAKHGLPYLTSTSTTTTPVSTTLHRRHDCVENGTVYEEGDAVPNPDVCQNCFCVKGEVRCGAVQCTLEMKGCEPIVQPGKCCPTGYNCSPKRDGDEIPSSTPSADSETELPVSYETPTSTIGLNDSDVTESTTELLDYDNGTSAYQETATTDEAVRVTDSNVDKEAEVTATGSEGTADDVSGPSSVNSAALAGEEGTTTTTAYHDDDIGASQAPTRANWTQKDYDSRANNASVENSVAVEKTSSVGSSASSDGTKEPEVELTLTENPGDTTVNLTTENDGSIGSTYEPFVTPTSDNGVQDGGSHETNDTSGEKETGQDSSTASVIGNSTTANDHAQETGSAILEIEESSERTSVPEATSHGPDYDESLNDTISSERGFFPAEMTNQSGNVSDESQNAVGSASSLALLTALPPGGVTSHDQGDVPTESPQNAAVNDDTNTSAEFASTLNVFTEETPGGVQSQTHNGSLPEFTRNATEAKDDGTVAESDVTVEPPGGADSQNHSDARVESSKNDSDAKKTENPASTSTSLMAAPPGGVTQHEHNGAHPEFTQNSTDVHEVENALGSAGTSAMLTAQPPGGVALEGYNSDRQETAENSTEAHKFENNVGTTLEPPEGVLSQADRVDHPENTQNATYVSDIKAAVEASALQQPPGGAQSLGSSESTESAVDVNDTKPAFGLLSTLASVTVAPPGGVKLHNKTLLEFAQSATEAATVTSVTDVTNSASIHKFGNSNLATFADDEYVGQDSHQSPVSATTAANRKPSTNANGDLFGSFALIANSLLKDEATANDSSATTITTETPEAGAPESLDTLLGDLIGNIPWWAQLNTVSYIDFGDDSNVTTKATTEGAVGIDHSTMVGDAAQNHDSLPFDSSAIHFGSSKESFLHTTLLPPDVADSVTTSRSDFDESLGVTTVDYLQNHFSVTLAPEVEPVEDSTGDAVDGATTEDGFAEIPHGSSNDSAAESTPTGSASTTTGHQTSTSTSDTGDSQATSTALYITAPVSLEKTQTPEVATEEHETYPLGRIPEVNLAWNITSEEQTNVTVPTDGAVTSTSGSDSDESTVGDIDRNQPTTGTPPSGHFNEVDVTDAIVNDVNDTVVKQEVALTTMANEVVNVSGDTESAVIAAQNATVDALVGSTTDSNHSVDETVETELESTTVAPSTVESDLASTLGMILNLSQTFTATHGTPHPPFWTHTGNGSASGDALLSGTIPIEVETKIAEIVRQAQAGLIGAQDVPTTNLSFLPFDVDSLTSGSNNTAEPTDHEYYDYELEENPLPNDIQAQLSSLLNSTWGTSHIGGDVHQDRPLPGHQALSNESILHDLHEMFRPLLNLSQTFGGATVHSDINNATEDIISGTTASQDGRTESKVVIEASTVAPPWLPEVTPDGAAGEAVPYDKWSSPFDDGGHKVHIADEAGALDGKEPLEDSLPPEVEEAIYSHAAEPDEEKSYFGTDDFDPEAGHGEEISGSNSRLDEEHHLEDEGESYASHTSVEHGSYPDAPLEPDQDEPQTTPHPVHQEPEVHSDDHSHDSQHVQQEHKDAEADLGPLVTVTHGHSEQSHDLSDSEKHPSDAPSLHSGVQEAEAKVAVPEHVDDEPEVTKPAPENGAEHETGHSAEEPEVVIPEAKHGIEEPEAEHGIEEPDVFRLEAEHGIEGPDAVRSEAEHNVEEPEVIGLDTDHGIQEPEINRPGAEYGFEEPEVVRQDEEPEIIRPDAEHGVEGPEIVRPDAEQGVEEPEVIRQDAEHGVEEPEVVRSEADHGIDHHEAGHGVGEAEVVVLEPEHYVGELDHNQTNSGTRDVWNLMEPETRTSAQQNSDSGHGTDKTEFPELNPTTVRYEPEQLQSKTTNEENLRPSSANVDSETPPSGNSDLDHVHSVTSHNASEVEQDAHDARDRHEHVATAAALGKPEADSGHPEVAPPSLNHLSDESVTVIHVSEPISVDAAQVGLQTTPGPTVDYFQPEPSPTQHSAEPVTNHKEKPELDSGHPEVGPSPASVDSETPPGSTSDLQNVHSVTSHNVSDADLDGHNDHDRLEQVTTTQAQEKPEVESGPEVAPPPPLRHFGNEPVTAAHVLQPQTTLQSTVDGHQTEIPIRDAIENLPRPGSSPTSGDAFVDYIFDDSEQWQPKYPDSGVTFTTHDPSPAFVGLMTKGSIIFDSVLPLSRRGRPTVDERTGQALPTPRKSGTNNSATDGEGGNVGLVDGDSVRVIPFLPEDAITDDQIVSDMGATRDDDDEPNRPEPVLVANNGSALDVSTAVRVVAADASNINAAPSQGEAEVPETTGTTGTPLAVESMTPSVTNPNVTSKPVTVTTTVPSSDPHGETTTVAPPPDAHSVEPSPPTTTPAPVPTVNHGDPFHHRMASSLDLPRESDYCVEQGEVFQDGERIPTQDFCTQCRCVHGIVQCQHVTCPSRPRGCTEKLMPSSCCPAFVCNETDLEEGGEPSDELPLRKGITIHGGFLPIERPPLPPPPPSVASKPDDDPSPSDGSEHASAAEHDEAHGHSDTGTGAVEHGVIDSIEGHGESHDVHDRHHDDVTTTTARTTDAKVIESLLEGVFGSSIDSATAPASSATTLQNENAEFLEVERDPEDRIFAKRSTAADTAEPTTAKGMTTETTEAKPETPSAPSGLWPMLKVSGCNIYGRVYQVGSTIGVLSGPCKECKCGITGVECYRVKCF